MRKQLEHLQNKVNWIDTDNLYQAVADIKTVLSELIELADQALPKEVDND